METEPDDVQVDDTEPAPDEDTSPEPENDEVPADAAD